MEKLSKEAQEDLACAVIELGAKNKRLRQQNAELVEALCRVIAVADRDTVDFRFAKTAIAKATGGK